MRVITGVAKGRKLKAPKGLDTRPTTDRTKESLFNIIGFRVQDAKVLDLFAGTGAIGIEALSRGAEKVVFVEKNPQVIRIIEDNLMSTGLSPKTQILCSDGERALYTLASAKHTFDLIYLDPPYLKDMEKRCLQLISDLSLVTPDGLVITETSKRDIMPEVIGHFKSVRQEKYGDTVLTFYEKV